MKKLLSIIAISLTLQACEKPPSGFTTEDLMKNEELRKEVKTWCDADETRWMNHSDCLKLSKATRMLRRCRSRTYRKCEF